MVLLMGSCDYSIMVFGTDLEFNINDGSEIINLRDDKKKTQ